MTDNNEFRVTENVINSMASAPYPRVRTVLTSLVRHVHDFVREAEVTQQELAIALRFLIDTGRISTDSRPEFTILSDALGISTLVNAVNHRVPENATETTTFGPAYLDSPPTFALGSSTTSTGGGDPLFVAGRVLSIDGSPIPNAQIDVWEANREGLYDIQLGGVVEMNLRGRFRADVDGKYSFIGIYPTFYAIPHDGPVGELLRASGRHPFRPPHVHFFITAAEHRTLTTSLFVREGPYIDSDVVFETKDRLIVDYVRHESAEEAAQRGIKPPFYTVDFDFVLQPFGHS